MESFDIFLGLKVSHATNTLLLKKGSTSKKKAQDRAIDMAAWGNKKRER